jgi:carbon starvation protein
MLELADSLPVFILPAVKKSVSLLLWLAVALLGASAYFVIATRRGEPVSSAFILIAALCTYAVGYRFYSKWIAARVLALDERRATPCEIHEDGKDFVKTNKWIVFGHHFAAISGPGPLVGPVLAAQFGYLPGTLWILIGVALGGAVQDFVILVASMRRDGRSLGQMVKEELNSGAGVIGTIAILSIMIILLAVLALVVVNALAESPWGVFTVAATIPIALFMGGYLRWVRVGKVLEASAFGVVLLLLAVWGGQWISDHETLRVIFKKDAAFLAWSIIAYGFAASVLPVWLLLAPRDYLSTFMKLGTIFALALGTLLVLPDLKMPALTKFIDGSGPVVPGKLFPFCFITIACGAISGFHTLISSGITPKIITRESFARPVGYGAMCLESLVAIMALIAACTLEPGVYLSINIKGPPSAVVEKVNALGFAVTGEQMSALAREVHEDSLFGRTGGAATLAVGMANLFSRVVGENWLGVWYHFALMFEALFILTTLDAGTRVGRYLLQDALSHVWKPFGDTRSLPAGIIASAAIVGLWGYFLIGAVHDPDGGIKALWPIFGIANQLLASIALCLATTILLKRQIRDRATPAIALVTLLPLLWLLAVTGTAGVEKICDKNPAIGFLAKADQLSKQTLPAQKKAGDTAGALTTEKQIHNNHLDALVTAAFLALVVAIVGISVFEWLKILAGKKSSALSETEPVWLPASALTPERPMPIIGLAAFGLTLLKELSGEAAIDRERTPSQTCTCPAPENTPAKSGTRRNVFLTATEHRFKNLNRCC